MPSIVIDGIETRYEVRGSGEPLLMFSPGGFDATLEKWSSLGIYGKTRMLGPLAERFQCILFDRRETGASGGRVECVTWSHYVAQGKGLLEHLGHGSAHLMGGCMGCSPVIAFAARYPRMVRSMVLYWPVGGAKYRISGHQRFTTHLAFVQQEGLAAVAALAQAGSKSFGEDPRGGPWVSVLRRDPEFAAAYQRQDVERYKLAVLGMMRARLNWPKRSTVWLSRSNTAWPQSIPFRPQWKIVMLHSSGWRQTRLSWASTPIASPLVAPAQGVDSRLGWRC